jgi:hypothetical protein
MLLLRALHQLVCPVCVVFRVWPEGAPPLQPDELAVRLREEMAPMVGRGKLAVSGPPADGTTSWEAARGRGRNSELAARFSKDHVKPLMVGESSDSGFVEPRGGRGLSPAHARVARTDHVRELLRTDEQAASPAPVLPWFHAHRAAIDSVGPLMEG